MTFCSLHEAGKMADGRWLRLVLYMMVTFISLQTFAFCAVSSLSYNKKLDLVFVCNAICA